MNYSCISTIQKNGIFLSQNILGPLGATNGSPLWGLFYPTQYPAIGAHADIMLTPIPETYWPFSARIKMRLWHRAQSLAVVTKYLADQNIIVLSCAVSRSAHRYATAVLTIAFGNLLRDARDFPDEASQKRLCARTKEELKHLLEALPNDDKVGKVCFTAEKPANLQSPVWGEVLHALQFFWMESRRRRTGPSRDIDFKVSRFVLTKGVIRPEGESRDLLDALFQNDSLPTRGVAEADTADMNMRIAFIDKSRLDDFATITVPYTWRKQSTDTETSAGVLAEIAQRFGPEFDLWRYTSEYEKISSAVEKGRLSLIAQAVGSGDGAQTPGVWQALEEKLRRKGEVFNRDFKTYDVQVTPFSYCKIFLSCGFRAPRFEDIREICFEEGTRFGMTEDDWIISVSRTKGVRDEVAKDIRSADGMLQYYSAETTEHKNSAWLDAEHFGAIVAGIPIAILKEKGSPADLPKTQGGQAPIEVEHNASKDKLRESIREGIEALLIDIVGSRRKVPRLKRS